MLLVCPECAHEWSAAAKAATDEDDGRRVVKDAVGNVLADGDNVTVIKDLKIKGSSSVVKIGTKVRNIRLIDGTGGPASIAESTALARCSSKASS